MNFRYGSVTHGSQDQLTINKLHSSSMAGKILKRELLPDLECEVSKKPYKLFHSLVYVLYLKRAMFTGTIVEAMNKKENPFSGT